MRAHRIAAKNGEYVAEFETDEGPVRLTYVAYGRKNDCSSGCFTSFVCAIEAGERAELYYASWNPGPSDEVPLEWATQRPGVVPRSATPRGCP